MAQEKPKITKIKMRSNRLASGTPLYKGKPYSVPKDLSLKDAVILVVCGHAEDLSAGKEKPKNGDGK